MNDDELTSLELRCPDDGHVLRMNTEQDVHYAECRHCDGIWLPGESIAKPGRLSLPSRRRKPFVATLERNCPRCWVRLEELHVEEHLIDECPKCHGVWLDPGEYRAVRRRATAIRIGNERPSLRKPRSRAAKILNRILDIVGFLFVEEKEPFGEMPEVDPKSFIPRPRRR